MGGPKGIFICRTCGRVLDSHSIFGWQHSLVDSPADHPVDPVPQGVAPTRGRCDFCSLDEPEFVLPAGDFEVLAGHVSKGAWAACRVCAGLIEADKWGQVIQRAADLWFRKEGTPMPQKTRTSLSVMFHLLRQHREGPVEPMPGFRPLDATR
jgi:hypothetical protein